MQLLYPANQGENCEIYVPALCTQPELANERNPSAILTRCRNTRNSVFISIANTIRSNNQNYSVCAAFRGLLFKLERGEYKIGKTRNNMHHPKYSTITIIRGSLHSSTWNITFSSPDRTYINSKYYLRQNQSQGSSQCIEGSQTIGGCGLSRGK